MTTTKPEPGRPGPAGSEADEDPLPSISEQVSQQLGGVRGLVESGIPVIVFVMLNFIGSKTHAWSLRTSLIAAVAFSVGMAVLRLSRRRPVRHAVNGVFGIALGAFIAWRSGEAKDFYLPGIVISAGYAVALLASVAIRRPLVGWIWSVMLDGGGTRWYRQRALLRTFDRLTALWVLIYLLKVGGQYWLYLADQEDWLGVVRIVFGWPPYALLLALTVWSARRVIHREAALTDGIAAPAP